MTNFAILKKTIMADTSEKKERWTNYLAITTVLIAVCATLSTFKGGGYSTRSLLNQTLAANQWSYFQSKSIKSYLFEVEKNNLEFQKSILQSPDPDILVKYDEKIASLEKNISRYAKEKEDIKKTAEAHEIERDNCKLHSATFGIAVIFLQVSILLSSISALTKRKYIWFLSIAVGAAGIVYFSNGFFLFF
jgi:hypothetical protein